MGRNRKEGCYELLRFCNKLNTTVIGGASKLFKYFVRTYSPLEVISYADKRWSAGDIYKNMGFCLTGTTKPNYFYVVDNKRENRYKHRKSELVKQGYDPNMSESEIMKSLGINKIYDCGNLKFKYINKDK